MKGKSILSKNNNNDDDDDITVSNNHVIKSMIDGLIWRFHSDAMPPIKNEFSVEHMFSSGAERVTK